jgi:hypothetical protein
MPKLQRRSLQQLQTLLHLWRNGLLLLQRLKVVKSLFWHGGNADSHRFKPKLAQFLPIDQKKSFFGTNVAPDVKFLRVTNRKISLNQIINRFLIMVFMEYWIIK